MTSVRCPFRWSKDRKDAQKQPSKNKEQMTSECNNAVAGIYWALEDDST